MAVQDLAEVTPDTTTADIAAYAKQVAEEVAAERQGEPEPKSDAQITVEHADTVLAKKPTETPAEDKSGSNTAEDEGEKSGKAADGPKWLTDDVKAEAAAYGFDESDIADFTSREELDRAFRLADKMALEAGRKAKAESEGQTRNDKGQFAKKEEPTAEQAKEETPKDGRYKVSLNAELYDEEIIGELTRMSDHYESRLAKLESHLTEANAVATERHFDRLVDSLGHADLFGTTDKESVQEKERRESLFEEVETYLAGRAAVGRPVELNDTIVRRIAHSLFNEELSKKLIKQQTRKIAKQSDSRMGGSPTKPTPPSDDPRDHFDHLYREMAQS
mgnify:CR=1 FL=1